jgi:hypothetical protein
MGSNELFESKPVIRVLAKLFGSEGFWLPLIDMVYGVVEDVFMSVNDNCI